MARLDIDAIIFDLDGVIVSTDEYHYEAWKYLADKLGLHFDWEVNHRLRGVSRMECLEIILEQYTGPALSPDEKTALADEKNALYQSNLMKMTSEDLPKDVMITLEALRGKGMLMAIGSSSKNAGLILSRIGLCDYFDAVVGGGDISHSKPHPEVFLKAAEQLNVKPERCLVVEKRAWTPRRRAGCR
jgi:beta-phosphoglucomutase